MVYGHDCSRGEVEAKRGSTILAVVAGVVVAVVIVFVFEAAGHSIWPPPPGLDVSDPEALKALMPSIPIGAKVAVVVAWVAGAFGGGSLRRVSPSTVLRPQRASPHERSSAVTGSVHLSTSSHGSRIAQDVSNVCGAR